MSVVMVYVSVLHAPGDEALAERVAAGLMRRGGEAHLVSGDALEGDLATDDAPAVVIWTPRSVTLQPILRQARSAMARGCLIPVKVARAAPPSEFASLAPADLTGWSGDDNDPRWRFVAEEIALITARTRLQDGDVWTSPPDPPADEFVEEAAVEDAIDPPANSVADTAAPAHAIADVSPRHYGFQPKHVLYAASAALLGFTALVALTAPIFLTGTNDTPQSAAQPEAPLPSASLTALTISPEPQTANIIEDSDFVTDDEVMSDVSTAEPALVSPPPLRDVEPIAVASQPQLTADEEAQFVDQSAPPSAPRMKPAAERIVTAMALQADAVAEDVTVSETLTAPGGETDSETVGDYLRDCFVCPDMAVVPPGRFLMGSPENEHARHLAEGPLAMVDIIKGFAMAAHEITIEQWDACVAGGGCRAYTPPAHGWGRGKQPVVSVSFDDAQSYVAWLSDSTGRAYRLPSEAEWEYAARAGSSGPFFFGARLTAQDANYNTAYTYGGPVETAAGRAVEAGSFSPNDFGLFDMHGNVWEWTADCWAGSHQDADVNGAPRNTKNGGDCTQRVLKGGAWNTGGWRLRSAHRIGKPANVREYDNGFRIVRDLD